MVSVPLLPSNSMGRLPNGVLPLAATCPSAPPENFSAMAASRSFGRSALDASAKAAASTTSCPMRNDSISCAWSDRLSKTPPLRKFPSMRQVADGGPPGATPHKVMLARASMTSPMAPSATMRRASRCASSWRWL